MLKHRLTLTKVEIPRMFESVNEQTDVGLDAISTYVSKIGINVDAANNLEEDVGAERRYVTDEKKIRMMNPAMVEILDNAELSYNCANRWL